MQTESELKEEFKQLRVESLIVLLYVKIKEKNNQLQAIQEEIKILQTCYTILKENEKQSEGVTHRIIS
jgi:hypothetical protein